MNNSVSPVCEHVRGKIQLAFAGLIIFSFLHAVNLVYGFAAWATAKTKAGMLCLKMIG
jgi:hypothetical protein